MHIRFNRPLRAFLTIGACSVVSGLVLGLRFLYFFVIGQGGGHVQSLILTAILLIVGFQIMMMGVIADLIGFNRKIQEETLYRLRKAQLVPDATQQDCDIH